MERAEHRCYSSHSTGVPKLTLLRGCPEQLPEPLMRQVSGTWSLESAHGLSPPEA